jgi:hypothetical protein
MHMTLPDAKEGQNSPRCGEEVRDRELFPASTIGSSAARRYNQVVAIAEQ